MTLYNSGLIGEKSSRVVVQMIYNNKTEKKYVVKVSRFQKQIMVSKLLPKTKANLLSWKITYYLKVNTKRESMFFLHEDRLSFVLNLKQ